MFYTYLNDLFTFVLYSLIFRVNFTYFMGHGGFDRDADEGYIALVDEYDEAHRLTATQLGRVLADHQSLRLAVLNSCEGGTGSEHDIFSSTAAILERLAALAHLNRWAVTLAVAGSPHGQALHRNS